MKKRVAIQTPRGIRYPGGLPSPRRNTTMLRSRQQTYTFVAGVFILYAIFATTRSFLPVATDLPILSAASDIGPPSSYYDKTPISVTEDDGNCPEYGRWAAQPHEPRSAGRYRLPYQRPAPGCRKIVIPEVEEVIREMNKTIKDPDLFRLFENCFPNTLDTSVTWTGVSKTNMQEEVCAIPPFMCVCLIKRVKSY
jgi:hypothetical protein